MSERPRKPAKDKNGPPSRSPAPPEVIRTHRELAAKTAQIVSKLNRDPALAAAMFLNPAAAIREAGYDLSPAIVSHITDTIRHATTTRRRREEIEASLAKALGEPPQPQDPAWLARMLFERLQVAPVETRGAEPIYRSRLSADALERLQKLRPKLRKRAVKTLEPLHGTAFRVSFVHPAPQRWDLDARLPELKRREKPPESVDLDALYFYKDAHPLVRPLLELALIRRSTFPLQSADSYRKIRRGEKPNPLTRWITRVRFAEP